MSVFGRVVVSLTMCFLVMPAVVLGGDWPMWRYDAQRSAASPSQLPEQLRLHWQLELPQLKPAWPEQPKMQFDAVYEPVVSGQLLFIGSSFDNSVTAFNTHSGAESWRFIADGPVRFAPLAWRDNLYFVADDGYLYCLRASDGKLQWRFRGGPADKLILGNERLISTWPARGAPVIVDETIYFTAGIWPFMGIFMHALDAQTGRVLWTNDGDGSIYIKQPHNSDSFAGVAPQGALVVVGDKLLIPGGRSVPACYDRHRGEMLYYALAENGKKGGGSSVAAFDQWLFNGGAIFDLEDEGYLGSVGEQLTFADGFLFDYYNRKLRAHDVKSAPPAVQEVADRKGAKTTVKKWTAEEVGSIEIPHVTALIKSGSQLYIGCENRLMAYALPVPKDNTSTPVWEHTIAGVPKSLVAADDRLFAVTEDGTLYCFGDAAQAPESAPRIVTKNEPLPTVDFWIAKARNLVEAAHAREGYCVVWGLGTGQLANALIRETEFRLVIVEPDSKLANAYRVQLRAAGIGAEQVTVLVADPLNVRLPPYLATLMVSENISFSESQFGTFVQQVFSGLRPFGGTACLPTSAEQFDRLSKTAEQLKLVNAKLHRVGDISLLCREGALPGSADWTHEHADAANTRVSKDQLVKAPLGLLWFGGPSNESILPRHGHGPQPQVVQGRLYIEGMDLLRAMDIYTGRVLWESKLPGLGTLYDNTSHQPGANASGTNYIATPDGIYVAYGQVCVQLDPATGSKINEFKLPTVAGSNADSLWGYINVADEYLVGGADPLFDRSLMKSRSDNDNYSSSQRLAVFDRKSGKLLWTVKSTYGFRHNGICIGGGKIYCIDRLSGAQVARLKRRGETSADKPKLVVLDLKNGKELWKTDADIFGTWLSYSAERDVLVEAGRVARDSLGDEPKGMRAYRASDGTILWENKSHAGPAMIHHDTILMAGNACDLLTGAPRMREHPISGEQVAWAWSRNYGCNTPMASEHLLTFRSGAAGYFDFCNDGGTGNFGGFRSSCSNNLIVAGGLLNAPDYTRTCTCSYQNQTSLALIPMPEVETWTSFGAQTPKLPVRRVGVNLGAPGDRKAEDGTLWLEYPSVGGASPELAITTVPTEPKWFRRHSSVVRVSATGASTAGASTTDASTTEGSKASGLTPGSSGRSWVAASGAKGLNRLEIKLADSESEPRRYVVRLHFVESDPVQIGDRVFEVSIQNVPVIASLDIFKEAGGHNRPLVKEFRGIEAGQTLRIALTPASGARVQETVLCGVELQAEGW